MPWQHACMRGTAPVPNRGSGPAHACACAAAPQESPGALADRAGAPGLAADAGGGACHRHRQRSDLLLRCALRQVGPPCALPWAACSCLQLQLLYSRVAQLEPRHEGRSGCIRRMQHPLCCAGVGQPDLSACLKQAISNKCWTVQQFCWPSVPCCGARHSFSCTSGSAMCWRTPVPTQLALHCMALHLCGGLPHTS